METDVNAVVPESPYEVVPLAAPAQAVITLPGSKSVTNRALLLAALAKGTSTIDGALVADDSAAMLRAIAALGAQIDTFAGGTAHRITGIGGLIPAQPLAIDAERAGTVARFLAPVLALAAGPHRLDGDEQLRARPMGPGLEALRQLGASVTEHGRNGHLPVVISGPATGGWAEIVGDISSQFLSGLMLAGPLLPRGLTVRLTTRLAGRPFVEMTAEMMRAFGAKVGLSLSQVVIAPGSYEGRAFTVEPDASAASYFLAAAALTGGRVAVSGLGHHSLQGDARFATILEKMGAAVSRTADTTEVIGLGRLHGIDADLASMPDMVLTLAVVAAFADSPTRIRSVGFIRHHESDRLQAIASELGKCGVRIDAEPDGLLVHPSRPSGALVDSHGDHRVAMSLALLGLTVPGVSIANAGCVAKTFPGFFAALDALRA